MLWDAAFYLQAFWNGHHFKEFNIPTKHKRSLEKIAKVLLHHEAFIESFEVWSVVVTKSAIADAFSTEFFILVYNFVPTLQILEKTFTDFGIETAVLAIICQQYL